MENASKALIMAAGVLMGTLILSLAVYLFSTFSATANDNYDRMRTEEIAQFNSFYLSYEGRTDLTYYDIWTVLNKAKDNNEKYGEEGINVEVYFGSSNRITEKNSSIKELKVLLGLQPQDSVSGKISVASEDKFELINFKCDKLEYAPSGRVNEIHFSR